MKVENNIWDILRYIDITKGLQDSVHKINKLAMLKEHLNTNTEVLEDLILILSVVPSVDENTEKYLILSIQKYFIGETNTGPLQGLKIWGGVGEGSK